MAYYKKPKDVRYVDMAIWIDENAYRTDLTTDEKNQIFEYLYHLAIMLAGKEKYFKYEHDYQNFGIYFGSRLYFRLTNPKQFIMDDNGEPKLAPIKSILNFMKKMVYPCKVDYQQEYYAQTYTTDKEQKYSYQYTVQEIVTKSMNDLAYSDFELYLLTSDKTIKNFLQHIPHKGNIAEWNNIYLSCMLTFLNAITIKDDIQSEVVLMKNYDRQAQDSVILWHLPEHMKSYIQILVTEIKHLLAQDLSQTLHTYITPSANMDLMTVTGLSGTDEQPTYED